VSRVLVTGATGFIGSAVARQFVAAGFVVRVLVRPASPRINLHGLDVEIVEGDVRDRPSIDRAMAGVRYVVHAAADYRLWARREADILRTNVEGTRHVVESAAAAGVEKFVMTSSVATVALRPDGEPSDESQVLAERDAIGAYKRSKVLAEALVIAAARSGALAAVIVNPSAPVGPRDIKPTPTGRVVVEAAAGRMPAYVDTGLNLVHVDDVARGHLQALHKGTVGERYILGGQNVPLGRMLADIAHLVGRPPPRWQLPRAPLYPLAACAEAVARLTGKEPFITLDGLRMARYRMYFSAGKAERELGFTARPYVDGLRDAIEWFSAAGYLKP